MRNLVSMNFNRMQKLWSLIIIKHLAIIFMCIHKHNLNEIQSFLSIGFATGIEIIVIHNNEISVVTGSF